MNAGKHAAEDRSGFKNPLESSYVATKNQEIKGGSVPSDPFAPKENCVYDEHRLLEAKCECGERSAYIENRESEDKGFLKTFLSVLIAVVLIFPLTYFLRAFVVEPYSIPSGSMEQTIMTGDSVLGEKITYLFRKPVVGDIVTFTDPEADTRLLIKRVVATEGQEVNLVGGKLIVDGVEQNYDYTNGLFSYPLPNSIAIKSYPYTVPEGHVFVMGDNRENSQDSRYFGAVDVSTVQSRAFLVYWPFNHIHGL